MVSPSREYDREVRTLFMECMAIALRTGFTEDAKVIGATSSMLKKRIETHDYKKEDESYHRVSEIIKRKV